MADELNIPTHRWYQPRNHVKLAASDVSKQWIYASGISKIDAWINSQVWGNPVPGLFASSEPGVWYDASDITTLFQDSAGTTPVTDAGQPVGKMLDKSGGGNHAIQATSTQRPIYQIDGTGRHYLLFDGVDDNMVTPTITPSVDKVQAFIGLMKLSDALNANIFELSPSLAGNDGSVRFTAPNTDGAASYSFLSKGTVSSTTIKSTGYAAPITNVLTGLSDIAAPNQYLRANGTQIDASVTTQGTGNFLAYPIYVGSRAGTSAFFNGRLYSLIVRFGANLTPGQIASTEAWVNGKTGAY